MTRVRCYRLYRIFRVWLQRPRCCFVLFLIFFLLFLDKWCLHPGVPTEPPNVDSLRQQGWKTVHHATTYFVTSKWLEIFRFEGCSEARCVMVADSRRADAVLFHMTDIFLQWWSHIRKKVSGQIWVLYGRESPTTTLWYTSPMLDGLFNWTMTHQRNSEIVANYNSGCKWKRKDKAVRKRTDYLKGRRKEAYIVTSNCHTASRRMEFIRKMQRHIQVDVFGACGSPCSSFAHNCDFKRLAKEYKFYLSFENSLCRDYLSEKLFRNALRLPIVPVVRGGASRNDYERFLPDSRAIISADDFAGPEALARHLKVVGGNEALYRRHMAWRETFDKVCPPSEEMACQLCKALHNKSLTQRPRLLKRVSDVWNRHRDCRDPVVLPGRSFPVQLRDFIYYVFNIN